jgi:hypothetical protein
MTHEIFQAFVFKFLCIFLFRRQISVLIAGMTTINQDFSLCFIFFNTKSGEVTLSLSKIDML